MPTKNDRAADPDISPEYDFSKARRGVYLDRAQDGIKSAPLTPSSGKDRPAPDRATTKGGSKSSS